MEAAGLGVGIVALAGLFNNALDCFEYIQLGRNTKKDFATVTLRLENARLRLSRWGAAVGFSTATEQDANLTSSETSIRIKETLEQIIELFADAEDISNKFKTRNKASNALQLYNPATDLAPEMQILHSKMRELAIKRENTPMRASLSQKTKWALYEEKHFRRLVEDINVLVGDLVELFPAEEIQGRLADEEVAELGSERGFPALEGIAAEQDNVLRVAIEKTSNKCVGFEVVINVSFADIGLRSLP